MNTVLCDETLDEVEEVARFCFQRGVGVNFSVVHDQGRLRRRLNNDRYLEKIRWLRAEKKAGRPVATPYFLLDYYEQTLSGSPPSWTCMAGQKCFYVAPDGGFHYCAHVPPAGDFATITAADLALGGAAKGCEANCGVDCVVHTSLPYSRLGAVVTSEGGARLGAVKDDRFAGGSPCSAGWAAWAVRIENEPAVEGIVPAQIDGRGDHQLRDRVREPAKSRQQPDPDRVQGRGADLDQDEAAERRKGGRAARREGPTAC